MDVIKVWVPLREYLSVQALYDAANALYWKISERQNSTHLAFLKHQNTKTSLCELSKNHWVIAPFYISGPIKRKLQSTVSLDHPVAHLGPITSRLCPRETSRLGVKHIDRNIEVCLYLSPLIRTSPEPAETMSIFSMCTKT